MLNVSSNLLAQIIAIAFIPVLARIYSPADFGKAYVFLGVCSCLVAISSFRFAVTVPLAENDKQRNIGILLSIGIIFSMFLLIALTSLLFSPFEILKELEETESLLLFYFFFSSINNLLINVVIANGKYKSIGLAKVLSALILNFSRLAIVNFGFSDGLLYSLVLAEVAVSVILLVSCKQQVSAITLKDTSFKHFVDYIKAYKEFPIYQALSQLILISTQYAPAFMFSIFYSITEIGLFAMANNLVSLPVNSIGIALSQIYLGEFRKKENRPKMLKYSVFIILFFMLSSIVAACIFWLFGAQLVTIFLGEQWRDIVPIILSLMALGAAKLCVAVVSQSLNILKKQKLQLYINGIYFCLSYLSLILAIKTQMSFVDAVFIYTVASTFALFMGLLLIIMNIRVDVKNENTLFG